MEHVVRHLPAPFISANGRLEVHLIPAWQDNLIWLLVDRETKEAAAVDGPDAQGVFDAVARLGVRLTTIFNTHTHPDHVGINADLIRRGAIDGIAVVGPAKKQADVPGITVAVDDGDVVRLGKSEGRVLLTEGHIDGHISFVFDDFLFCGDTLFGAGCGYLFDGPPAKMHASLQRLAELPGETKVFCAHEYTEDNLRYAWSVEPDNEALRERIKETFALRAEGKCSVPSTVALERDTNPFVRVTSRTLHQSLKRAVKEHGLDASLATPADVFAATRALKDRKLYRETPDETFPG